MAQPDIAPSANQVICKTKKDLPVRLFFVAALCLFIGGWCFKDGFITPAVTRAEATTLNTALKYYFNTLGGIALPLLGLVPLVGGILVLRRTLVADDNGIGYQGKSSIPWSHISSVDASQLESKGILRLHYKQGLTEKTLKLDTLDLENFAALKTLVLSKTAAKA